MQKLIESMQEMTFDLKALSKMPLPKRVLMVSPNDFDIDNSINPHMQKQDGSLQQINKDKACAQWRDLKKVYEELNFPVSVVDSVRGLLDMVFCANQSFPFLDDQGHHHAVLSNMFDNRRHLEVTYISDFLTSQGYTTQPIGPRKDGCYFESMGDALWLNGVRLILGGYGFRTNRQIYGNLSKITQAPVAVFELKNPKFYHLDTCLSILNSTTALACQEAFTQVGWDLLNVIFPNVLRVPLEEADAPGFACNAHCPDEKHVIIQQGCSVTNGMLKSHGFVPIEVDTSEFIKSGGSVFCMKLMFW